jgi:hypothetical protein
MTFRKFVAPPAAEVRRQSESNSTDEFRVLR